MPELSAEQWAEVERLFRCASELPAEERAEFLERECADAELRREVASLLESSGERLSSALSEAIAVAAVAVARELDPDHRLIGTRLGPYKVEAIAGHGGMGAVYRASRDDAEFHQQVAIKLVRAAAASPSTLRRFRQERQILARLAHPNIARLLDGGSTPEGVPYLVMEFIEGEPITVWCERRSLKLEERLRLFLRVCEAVDFAHRDLVVHRDLKPANILVTNDGAPKLLDFGIAKLLDPAAEQEAGTLTGLQVMTPEYASPEQVRGEPVSTASDVYGLGLILYELLTGQKAQQISTQSPDAIARVVCQTEPTAPAARNPKLAGDLENIIQMAIRKEPARRYDSAGDLARDIERHLEGRPVMARSDTLAYRSGKFLKRNRFAVFAAVLIAAGLPCGLALAYWLGAFARPPKVSQSLQLTQTGRVEVDAGLVTDGARLYFTERSGGNSALAQVSVNGGTPQPIFVDPPISLPSIHSISSDHSQLLVGGGRGTEEGQPLWVVPTAGGTSHRLSDIWAHAATWSPDGKHIIFGRGSVIYTANADGTDCRKLVDTHLRIGDSLSWESGGDVLRVCLYSGHLAAGALWEMASDGSGLHRVLPGKEWSQSDYDGVWIPPGRYYLFRSLRGSVSSLWALREHRSWLSMSARNPVQIYSSPLHFRRLASSTDGKRIFFAAGQPRREFMRYDAARREFVPYLSGIAGRWIDYSRDGQWVAYTILPEDSLWRSRPDGSERTQLTFAPLRVYKPRWSPDGTHIAFGGFRPGEAFKAYVMPVSQSGGGVPEAIASLPLGEGEPSWSPDGKSLLFSQAPQEAPAESRLYVMDWKSRKSEPLPDTERSMWIAWSPAGRYVAALREGKQLRLFDFHTRQWTLLATGLALSAPFWSRDGKYVYYQELFGSTDQPIRRVRISDHRNETVASLRNILQSNVTLYGLSGLAPDDQPIVWVQRDNSDIYALDLDLP